MSYVDYRLICYGGFKDVNSRLVIQQPENNAAESVIDEICKFTRGEKIFELSNHFSNVLAVIHDRRKAVDDNTGDLVDYYGRMSIVKLTIIRSG